MMAIGHIRRRTHGTATTTAVTAEAPRTHQPNDARTVDEVMTTIARETLIASPTIPILRACTTRAHGDTETSADTRQPATTSRLPPKSVIPSPNIDGPFSRSQSSPVTINTPTITPQTTTGPPHRSNSASTRFHVVGYESRQRIPRACARFLRACQTFLASCARSCGVAPDPTTCPASPTTHETRRIGRTLTHSRGLSTAITIVPAATIDSPITQMSTIAAIANLARASSMWCPRPKFVAAASATRSVAMTPATPMKSPRRG